MAETSRANWIEDNGFRTLDDLRLAPLSVSSNSPPTLVPVTSQERPKIANFDASTFREKLFQLVPVFQHISLKGIATVGDFLVDALLDRTPDTIHLVLMLEKSTEDFGAAAVSTALTERARDFVEELLQLTDPEEVSVARCRGVHTIEAPCLPFPVRLACYDNLTAWFDTTDISCAEIAYYRHEVVMSQRGLDGLRNMRFVIGREYYKSRSKMQRIVRYFQMGFDIVLEHLKMNHVTEIPRPVDGTDTVLPLPYLTITFEGTEGNKILVNTLRPADEAEVYANMGVDDAVPLENQQKYWIEHNIYWLIHKKYSDMVFYGKGRNVLESEAFSLQLALTPEIIAEFYEVLRMELVEQAVQGVRIDPLVLQEYIIVRSTTQICLGLFAHVEIQWNNSPESGALWISDEFVPQLQVYLDWLIAEHARAAQRCLIDFADLVMDGSIHSLLFFLWNATQAAPRPKP
ncbi:uncharacterized protein LOC129589645 isoform X2 [Paramacrobiotus metropolitanus]|uniref:uncharacterized protein LOC129589645 isoform X2 n=1 Tax=Paramacrobiotus metropolitanus TaxID=2943436 RepID=UPI002445FE68|nr:uncharacterized protein LOC129589645 isoform X2 [Paramacrobiotus metropolitanus]